MVLYVAAVFALCIFSIPLAMKCVQSMSGLAVVFCALLCGASATSAGMSTMANANPIRRVVNMLGMMQKKVTEEGKKADDLFEKFMC